MLYAYVIKGEEIRVWGLTPYERIVKILKKSGDIPVIEDLSRLNENDEILLINGNYIFDGRVIDYLIKNKNIAISIGDNEKEVVAVHASADKSERCVTALKENDSNLIPNGIKIININEIQENLFLRSLKKVEKPFVLNVSKTPIDYMEDKLYYGSYKGVTDIVTRLVWPKPAKKTVKFCVDNKITPNQVTTLSLILALLAGGLFYVKLYVLGLIVGWFMTFLDTVDGKLARVTVNYSTFGHRYDHLIDLLSPVYWYICWGLGLIKYVGEPAGKVWCALWVIIIFYIIGRIVEGAFQFFLKTSFNIFCWKPFDSFFRLVTARRNPNLIILTIATLFNGFAIGFYLVALWTLFSSIILVIRLLQAYAEKKKKGELTSWLYNITPDMYGKKIYKLFIYEN